MMIVVKTVMTIDAMTEDTMIDMMTEDVTTSPDMMTENATTNLVMIEVNFYPLYRYLNDY